MRLEALRQRPKQELMVHATKSTPITIQMLQGEHFGTSAMVMNQGESKIWGPVLIYINKGIREEMTADAHLFDQNKG